jgi:hypothetical protein
MTAKILGRQKIMLFRTLPLVGVFLLSACADSHMVVEPRPVCDFRPLVSSQPIAEAALVPSLPGTISVMPLNTVNITDVSITNKIMVQAVSVKRMVTGSIEVWSRIVNCTDFPLQIEGRTMFMNRAKGPVEPPSAWQRVYLPARTIGTYQEKSITRDGIQNYLIEIREGS